MDHASNGTAALTSSHYPAAISHFTLAITAQPASPSHYIHRSTAYQRSKQPALALADAEKAVVLATQRGKRELIAQAQLRRGISLFQLGEYANAKFVLERARAVEGTGKEAGMWLSQVEGRMKGEEAGGGVVVTALEVPVAREGVASAGGDVQKGGGDGKEVADATAATPTPTPTPAPMTQTPKEKIRHDWYQSHDHVTITLLAKGVPRESTSVDITPTSVAVSFPLNTGATYDFSLDPLFAPVQTDASSHSVKSTKIEIILKKQTPGQKWASLEGAMTESTPASATGATPTTTAAATTATEEEKNGGKQPKDAPAPAYPTSSKSGPKNWDKIALSYQKPPPPSDKGKDKDNKGGEAKEHNDDDDEDDDNVYIDEYEDGDPANAFFKKLYAGADPDTRRAMVKSFQESGGTALSTDWGEVKKKKVEVSPPDGMEEKKWAA